MCVLFLQTLKFELDGLVRACCLAKPFTYAELLKSIQSLFGNQILNSLENIRCVFSRDDALRFPITNDEDLRQVIAIAETNQATKISFLLTRKKGSVINRLKSLSVQDDSGSVSDDPQVPDSGGGGGDDDNNSDSPPPGTIAPQKKRALAGMRGKTTMSKDGGSFIPESVSLSWKGERKMIDDCFFFCRLKRCIPVVVHRLSVENRVEVKLVPVDVYQVRFELEGENLEEFCSSELFAETTSNCVDCE